MPSPLPDWRTNCVYFSDRLPECQPTLWRELEGILRRQNVRFHFIADTKDVWVRDFMPIQIGEREFTKFVYQPDYLRGYPELTTGNEVLNHLPNSNECNMSKLIVDGGNIVASSDRVIMTDKVFSKNRRLSHDEVLSVLIRDLPVDEIIFIPTDTNDEIGHSDGVVRFLDDDSVIINDYSKVDADYGEAVESSLLEHGLNIEKLPYFFEDNVENGISSAVGNYVNYLQVDQLVVVPAYGCKEDEEGHREAWSNYCPMPPSCLLHVPTWQEKAVFSTV